MFVILIVIDITHSYKGVGFYTDVVLLKKIIKSHNIFKNKNWLDSVTETSPLLFVFF